jgi:excinuclease ABC subunit B
VVVVASVSCIFGLGSPDEYKASVIDVQVGQMIERDDLLRKFIRLQYDRNDTELEARHVPRARRRRRGAPAYEEYASASSSSATRSSGSRWSTPHRRRAPGERDQVYIFPAVHYVCRRRTSSRRFSRSRRSSTSG